MKTIIAADPGKGGGFAVLINGQIELHNMPETLTEISEWMRGYISNETVFVMEEIPKYCGGGLPESAIFKMAQNFGRLEGIAVSIGFKLVRFQPKAWQKGLGMVKGKLKSSKWKSALANRAKELYPHLHVTLKTSDALLILDWAVKNKEGNIQL